MSFWGWLVVFAALGISGCVQKDPLRPPAPETPDSNAVSLAREGLRRLYAVVPAYYGPGLIPPDTAQPTPGYTSEFMDDLDFSHPENYSFLTPDTNEDYGEIRPQDWNRLGNVNALYDTFWLEAIYTDPSHLVQSFHPEIFKGFTKVFGAWIKYYGHFPGPPFAPNLFVPEKMTALVFPDGGLYDSVSYVMTPGDTGVLVKTGYFNRDSVFAFSATPSTITSPHYLVRRTESVYFHQEGFSRVMDSAVCRAFYTFFDNTLYYTAGRYWVTGVADPLQAAIDTFYRGSRTIPFSDTLMGGHRAAGTLAAAAFLDVSGDTLASFFRPSVTLLEAQVGTDSMTFEVSGNIASWTDSTGALIWKGEIRNRFQALHVRLHGIHRATGAEILSGVVTLDPFSRKGRGSLYSKAFKTVYSLSIALDGNSKLEGLDL